MMNRGSDWTPLGGLPRSTAIRVSRWFGQGDLLFYLCAFVIVASLLLGGGTRGGFLSDAVLQFLAIPLLLVCLWKLFDLPLTK
jgi:hypothetical protein